MLGLRKAEVEERSLSVWCPSCQGPVGLMEWWANRERGEAVCPWCSEHFSAWRDEEFDPADLLGLRAHTR